MTGHRQGTGRPTRRAARIAEHDRRVMTAPTGKAQVAAAFDRWRSSAVRDACADTELHEVATWLNLRAIELERRYAA